MQLTAAQFLYLLPRFQPRERVAVALAGWLGPRVSEAFGLQWQDLDMESRVVLFRRGFVQGRITPLKTEASRTDLALPEDVVHLLVRWRSITPYNQPNDWVFASPFNKGIFANAFGFRRHFVVDLRNLIAQSSGRNLLIYRLLVTVNRNVSQCFEI